MSHSPLFYVPGLCPSLGGLGFRDTVRTFPCGDTVLSLVGFLPSECSTVGGPHRRNPYGVSSSGRRVWGGWYLTRTVSLFPRSEDRSHSGLMSTRDSGDQVDLERISSRRRSLTRMGSEKGRGVGNDYSLGGVSDFRVGRVERSIGKFP